MRAVYLLSLLLVASVCVTMVFGVEDKYMFDDLPLSQLDPAEAQRLADSMHAWPTNEIMPLVALTPELKDIQPERSLLQADSAAEAATEVEAEAETEVDAEAETESQSTAETEAETEVDAEAESGSTAEGESETESEAEAETATETEADSEQEVEVDVASEAELEGQVDAEAETETEVEADQEQQTEADVGADTESETKQSTESESEATAKVNQAAVAHVATESEVSAEAVEALRVKVRAHVASQIRGNGCGTGWTSYVVPDYPFLTACNGHDTCYDSCASSGLAKRNCDLQFWNAMNTICGIKWKDTIVRKTACMLQSRTYYLAVSRLGTGAYRRAQATAQCKVVPQT